MNAIGPDINSSIPRTEEDDDAITLLDTAIRRLLAVLGEEIFMEETPLEVQAAIELGVEDIRAARIIIAMGKVVSLPEKLAKRGGAFRPTRKQGQFLAFIAEYTKRAGVAPTHADLQRFFDLTPPSVNDMLVRLEQRGLIRRIPGQARAIEITLDAEHIPPLEDPFRVL